MPPSTSNLSQPKSGSLKLEDLDKEIRPFPATAAQIMTLCQSPESKIAEITELIECEPAIAIKLLAMANSPLFGAAREITSVSHAIVLMGYGAVSQMALAIAAGPLFSAGDPQLYETRVELFRRSLGVATTARLLAEKFDLTQPSEAFLGGMMLDVGKLLFLDVAPEQYLAIAGSRLEADATEVELQTFGIDHPQIGNCCGRKWGLPSAINKAIGSHHQNFADVEDGLTRAVIAGGYFASRWNVGVTDVSAAIVNEIESAFPQSEMSGLPDQVLDQFCIIESIFIEG